MQEPLPPTEPTPPHSQPPKKGLAIASLVLGILSVTGLFCLAGLPAIITGHIASDRARNAPERYGGAGFAKAGMVMGYVSIFLTLFLVVAVPNFIKAARGPAPIACIHNLRLIQAAKEQWALDKHKQPGDPVVDEEVNAYWKGSRRPVCTAGGTYSYNPVGVDPTCTRAADLGHTL